MINRTVYFSVSCDGCQQQFPNAPPSIEEVFKLLTQTHWHYNRKTAVTFCPACVKKFRCIVTNMPELVDIVLNAHANERKEPQ